MPERYLDPNDEFDRVIAGAEEAELFELALPSIRQYERGILTFNEFLNRLFEIKEGEVN